MGLTRSSLFSNKQNKLSRAAKALAHPARIAIIEQLLKTESCINSDLVEELGLAQATISQHLKELNDAGLIQGTIEGVRMSYCINPKTWLEVQRNLNSLFDQFSGPEGKECC